MVPGHLPRPRKNSSAPPRGFLAKSSIVAFWAFALAILVFALIPVTESTPSTGWDVNDHALAFTLLTVLGLRAYPRRPVNVVLGLIAFGLLIEVLQSFTSYRIAEWSDVVTDCIGIVLGCMLELVLRRSVTQLRL